MDNGGGDNKGQCNAIDGQRADGLGWFLPFVTQAALCVMYCVWFLLVFRLYSCLDT